MNTNDKTWESTKSNYLRQVERVLTAAKYPSRKSIIDEVRLHLEQRYAELPAEQRNWEGFQQVITEMGPPSDYAELLGVGRLKRRIITWRRIAVGFPIILVLLAYGMYKGIIPMGVYSGPRTYVIPELVGAPFERPFGSDGNLVGEWVTVDFVNSPSQFIPGKRRWPTDEFWLNEMTFTDGGDMRATVKGSKSDGKAGWASRCKWTKGWIMDREDRIQAQYSIKETDGELYLFYPWLSGDVSIRYLPPSYYVLKKAGSDRSAPPAGSLSSAKSQSVRVRFVPGSAPMKGAAAYDGASWSALGQSPKIGVLSLQAFAGIGDKFPVVNNEGVKLFEVLLEAGDDDHLVLEIRSKESSKKINLPRDQAGAVEVAGSKYELLYPSISVAAAGNEKPTTNKATIIVTLRL